jgi:acylpyruvate hydrolase
MSHISGYCLAIDYTARNMQDIVKASGLPWSAVKGFDTFCPISNFINKTQIPDPHNLELYFKLNGVIKQLGRTDLMLYRIPELIRHVSSIMKLEEGDLLLTGEFYTLYFTLSLILGVYSPLMHARDNNQVLRLE